MADALVVHRAKKEQQALTGTLELTDSTTGALLRFVAERYLNVLFGTVMTSLLKFRGKTLTAMELQDRLKTDEDFHRKLIKEYNDSSNTAYGQNAHGQEGCGYTDASNFQPFSEDSWEKSCKFFKELSKNYEFCMNQWRQSGNHGSLEDIVPPPERECSNPSMIYMHHHLRAHPDLLETCLGLLPDEVFRQSSSGAPRGGTRATRRGRVGGGGRSSGGGGRAKSAAAEDCLASIKSKNNAQQQNILMDTNTKLREEMKKEKQDKKVYMKKLTQDHFDDDREAAKRSIKRYKRSKDSGSTNNTRNAEEEDLSDDDDDFTESQESTLGNYVDSEDNIVFLEGQLDNNKKAMNKNKLA